MLRDMWERIRRIIVGDEQVTVEVLARRNGRLVRVPVAVRADDVERLYRRR
jgi:hypothetical protein